MIEYILACLISLGVGYGLNTDTAKDLGSKAKNYAIISLNVHRLESSIKNLENKKTQSTEELASLQSELEKKRAQLATLEEELNNKKTEETLNEVVE